jgi:hypothetical protein
MSHSTGGLYVRHNNEGGCEGYGCEAEKLVLRIFRVCAILNGLMTVHVVELDEGDGKPVAQTEGWYFYARQPLELSVELLLSDHVKTLNEAANCYQFTTNARVNLPQPFQRALTGATCSDMFEMDEFAPIMRLVYDVRLDSRLENLPFYPYDFTIAAEDCKEYHLDSLSRSFIAFNSEAIISELRRFEALIDIAEGSLDIWMSREDFYDFAGQFAEIVEYIASNDDVDVSKLGSLCRLKGDLSPIQYIIKSRKEKAAEACSLSVAE